jgi:hypothetical protein
MDAATHRSNGIDLFHRCWDLLEQAPSPERNEELLQTAWASLREWSVAAGPKEWAIGEWMLARCAGEAGFGALAVDAALRAHQRTQGFEAPDWLVASSIEGVARAYVDSGEASLAATWIASAAQHIEELAGEDDRTVLAGQLDETLARARHAGLL